MRRALLSVVLGLLLATSPLAAAQKILLVARDYEKRPLRGLKFTYGGVVSRPTNEAGATELDLPPGLAEGRQIEILLLPPPKRQDWFLVNSQVNVPGATESAALVLMHRSTIRTIAAEVRERPTSRLSRLKASTEEEQKRALADAAARHGLSLEQLETAIASFAKTQDPKDRGIALYLQGQYPQAETALTEAAKNQEHDFVETLRYLGASQFEQARYQAAADTFRKALALHGEDGELLTWLGRAFLERAEWSEAEPALRQARDLDEKNYGPEQPTVAIDLNNLAILLQATNRLAEAEPLFRRALAIDEKSFGPDHPIIAMVLNNLAQLLEDSNRLGEAEPLMRRALAIDEKSFGPEHPNVARDLNNLAQLLQDTHRLAEAEPMMRRALTIDEERLGPEHPSVAVALSNLASLLQATHRLDDAEPLLRRALAIDEKSLGPEHPNVAIRLNNLASLLKATHRPTEAEPLLRRALAIDEKSLGPDHPKVAIRLNNLALLLLDSHRLTEAEPLLRRTLSILVDFGRRSGHEHPYFHSALENYSVLLKTMGKSQTEIDATIQALGKS